MLPECQNRLLFLLCNIQASLFYLHGATVQAVGASLCIKANHDDKAKLFGPRETKPFPVMSLATDAVQFMD